MTQPSGRGRSPENTHLTDHLHRRRYRSHRANVIEWLRAETCEPRLGPASRKHSPRAAESVSLHADLAACPRVPPRRTPLGTPAISRSLRCRLREAHPAMVRPPDDPARDRKAAPLRPPGAKGELYREPGALRSNALPRRTVRTVALEAVRLRISHLGDTLRRPFARISNLQGYKAAASAARTRATNGCVPLTACGDRAFSPWRFLIDRGSCS